MSFGEEDRIPRILLILKEVNPQAIIGDDEFPGLTDGGELGCLLGAEELDDNDEYIDRNPIKIPHGRRPDTGELVEAVAGAPAGVWT